MNNSLKKVHDFFNEASQIIEKGASVEDTIAVLSPSYFEEIPEGEAKKTFLLKAIERYRKIVLHGETHPDIVLLKEDELFIRNIPEAEVRKIMFCFVCYYREYYHESGWVKWENMSEVLEYCFPEEKIKEVSQNIHKCLRYGLEMQVKGSKIPITCFHLPLDGNDGEVWQTFSAERALEVFEREFSEKKR